MSKLRNKLNKEKSFEANLAYKKQRNICTSLLKQSKKAYYSNLNPSIITNSKMFWKTIKPVFTDKVQTNPSITLVENNDICHEDDKVAGLFNTFFSKVVENLNLKDIDCIDNGIMSDMNDPVITAVAKYQAHPSIIRIKESMMGNNVTFQFLPIEEKSIRKEIVSLIGSKATPKDAIPPKVIKENWDIFSYKIHIDFNKAIKSGVFPDNLKYADVSPAFKKGDRLNKANYRPVSVLSSLSKIFERLIFAQVNTYMDPKLSIYQCGFRKNMSAQNCILLLLEKWKTCLDNKGKTGVLLMDLSKAFDCLDHELLIAKLDAYGFGDNALKLMYSYINSRQQRVRINSTYSSWADILFGVPQGSILGPLIFNIYLADLFLFCDNISIVNFADDNSPFSCKKDIESVINQLQFNSEKLMKWFENNRLKPNPDKFSLILSDTNKEKCIQIQQLEIQNSTCEKLLGIKIDNKLSFDEHITDLCCKATQKLHALIRVARFMTLHQKRIIMKAFINSQFGYCPLVWMFCSRKLNNRINRIHERALRTVYSDQSSSFDELLQKDGSVTIHVRNLQNLAVEIYKVVNDLAPEIMKEVFPIKKCTRYPSKHVFQTRNIHSTKYGIESLAHFGPKLWDLVPKELKEIKCLNLFKKKAKLWIPTKCPCKLCKTYIAGVGYID